VHSVYGVRMPLRPLVLGLVLLLPGAARADAVGRANALLARMTHDEKVALVASGADGVPRLGIPKLTPSDGPNGVRLGGTYAVRAGTSSRELPLEAAVAMP
jgi:hypothetical protein